ncbi:zinc finger protein 711-like isoform X1 [Choristoneura fumiferana]|uniref:zinc finger protein 711-like isoform X1 n=1 Tax=Choristoneura fumiferana TaxID=7141 RepID=UPI003D157A8B
MVIKLAAFRTRVSKAQSAIADLLNGRPCQISSLSRFAIVTVTENPEDEAFEDVQALDPLYYQLVKDTVQIEYDGSGVEETKVDDDLMGEEEAMGDEEALDDEILADEAEDVETVVEEIICDDKNDVKNEMPVRIAVDHNYQTVSNVIVKPIQGSSKITHDKNRDKTFSNIAMVNLNYDERSNFFVIKNLVTNEISKISTNKTEGLPPLQPKPKVQDKSRSALKLRTCKRAQESTIEVENPFTVEVMSQEEMLIWKVRKANMEFFTGCSPLTRCENCVEPFDTQRTYTAHMKGHTQDYGEKTCLICQLRFHDDEALEAHKEKHYKLLKCNYCEFEWDSTNGMRRHCAASHGVPVASLLCDQCDREFQDPYKLMRHRMCHLARKCPECGILLRSFVKKHMMRMHKNLPLLECDSCGLQCKGNSGLQDHIKNCRNVGDQTYCVECNVEYKNKYRYRAHFKNTVRHATHEAMKFHCSECGRGFLDAASLQNHRDAVHERERKYLCDHCGKGFFTMLSRKKHERRAHGSRLVRKNKVCDVCGKTYEKRRTLLDHMNTHTGQRPYKCACGVGFSYESALRSHERNKHGAHAPLPPPI